MITYKELREKLQELKKFPDCKKVARAPLIHDGFPGTFNLSFTEYDMLKEFNGYSLYDHDLIFSTIQSCIRPQDLENIKEGKGLWKYLGVFEMSDIAGQAIFCTKKDQKEILEFQLKRLIELLVSLGLKKECLYPSYQAGGKVSDITEGKYNFDFVIPEDALSKELFIEAGIPEENLIPDRTRNTLLSLHLHRKSPWGYRNEINYNIGTRENPIMLDIATLEHFIWLPTYSSKEERSKDINGLIEFPYSVSVGGVGVERLCMATNKHKTVYEVDHLKEFYDKAREIYPELSEESLVKVGEAIRTLHRIFSDIQEFKLERHIRSGNNRGRLIRNFLQILHDNLPHLDTNKLRVILDIHCKIQPWHKNLEAGIAPTMWRIEKRYMNLETQ